MWGAAGLTEHHKQRETTVELYAIGASAGPQAVGITANVDELLDQLQSAAADKLQIHRRYEFANGWDRLAERIATRPIEGYSQRGTWYRIDAAKAIVVVDSAHRSIDWIKSSKDSDVPRPNYGEVMRRIRVNVFGTTQEVIGAIAGASNSKVSRWESGEVEPSLFEIHRLREFAVKHSLPWEDSWLHEVGTVV